MAKVKEPIRIRQKNLANGNISLYLDIYINSKREYEFLKLYLVPEKTKADKEKNKQTLQLAEAIKAKKIVDLQNGAFGFNSGYKLETNFLDFYRAMCAARFDEKERSRGNWGNWHSCLRHLEKFCKPKMTFKDVTPEWVKKFKEHLDNDATCRDKRKVQTPSDIYINRPLSPNTKQSYFTKLRACINQAFEEGIMPTNPLRGIEGFREEEVERPYLTLEEVQMMAAAHCAYPALKQAFLFSCLTGIRKSDIEKMRWNEIQQQGAFTRIIFKQKKTKGIEYLDISDQAAQYLGERGELDARVFLRFTYSTYMRAELRIWAMRAGVTKDITFHCGRHTFAVMMLDLGADIFTVSKLLGHKELKTTQIYAKVLDKKKQEAVNLIPDILLK